MIIDPENNNNNQGNSPEPEEFVDSSFMVSLKGNDKSSVSDKIKENENSDNGFSDGDDEFDNFDYDASKSAFKPLSKPVTDTDSKPSILKDAEKMSDKPQFAEPPKASMKTDFEQVGTFDSTVEDANIDFKEFTGIKEDPNTDDKKLFEQGQDLDFAASSGSAGDFSGSDDEFALDEEAMAINPFKPKNADRIPPAPSRPKTPASKPSSENENAGIKTYGKVSSGVNAFKKPEPKAEKKEDEHPARSPFVKPASDEENKVETPAFKNNAAPAPAPVAEEAKPSPFVQKTDDGPKRPTSNVAMVTNSSRPAPRQAPVHNAPVKAPEAPAGRPGPAERPVVNARPGTGKSAHSSSDHQNNNIAPVTQVNKSNKRSKADRKVKEPGKGGLFALVGVLAAIFVVLWVLDNYQQWFGKNDTQPRTTQVTAVATATVQTEATEASEQTEPAVIETTEQTTAATTEQTAETSEVTEQTTEETTESTTEATTEATTTTTTEEETTATTTRSSSSSDTPVRCSYDITNPRVTSDGFVFDFAITNNGDDLNVSRLNEITISFNTSSDITALTSDYFTFTSDGNNSFTGTPRTGSLPSGETTNITITGTTEEHIQHFYINTYHFDWD